MHQQQNHNVTERQFWNKRGEGILFAPHWPFPKPKQVHFSENIFINDVFRSEELEFIRRRIQEKEDNATFSEVQNHVWTRKKRWNFQEELDATYPAMFRLLWRSALPCFPSPASTRNMLLTCSWQVLRALVSRAIGSSFSFFLVLNHPSQL